MATPHLDVLNKLVEDTRIRHVDVALYVINELSSPAFIKREVHVAHGVKFVQARMLAVRTVDGEFLAEGILYVAVPDTVNVGDFVIANGAIAPLSRSDYSRELTLMRFLRIGSGKQEWEINSVELKTPRGEFFKTPFINQVLKAWKQFPLTLTTNPTYVTPLTKFIEAEVKWDLDGSLLYEGISPIEYECPAELKGGDLLEYLTTIQSQLLKEVLIFPLLQLHIPDETFVTYEEVSDIIKATLGDKSKVFDLRGKSLTSEQVLLSLQSKGAIGDGVRYILATDKLTKGIPSITLGKECLM